MLRGFENKSSESVKQLKTWYRKCREENIANKSHLLGACVLCDSLGALGHSMLSKFSWQKEANSCLDLTRSDGGPLVVVGQLAGFSSGPLKQIVDKRVHDGHGLGRDSSVRVNLFQYLVDVDGIGLLPLALLLFLVPFSDRLGSFPALDSSLARSLGWHDEWCRDNSGIPPC